MPDIFSNLRDWRSILDQMEGLRRAGRLEEHQPGLVRILRYRFHWQLHHAVLEAVAELRSPSEELLMAICDIIPGDTAELRTRLLACDAVECLLRRLRNLRSRHSGTDGLRGRACDSEASQPPVLRQAIERWLELEPAANETLLSREPSNRKNVFRRSCLWNK